MPEVDRQGIAWQAFESAGALLRGHFVYTSGRHGADYLEKFRILEDPRATTALAAMIAARFQPLAPELVAGPTTGGIILAYEVARQLGVDAVYVERGEGTGRVLRRGFEIVPGVRVLVVDDVVTTGGSLLATTACITRAGGDVIGVGVLAAGSVATERQRQTLDGLLSLPGDRADVIRAKARAALVLLQPGRRGRRLVVQLFAHFAPMVAATGHRVGRSGRGEHSSRGPSRTLY